MNADFMMEQTVKSKLAAFAQMMQIQLSDVLPNGDARLIEAMRYSALSDSKYIRSFYINEIVKTLTGKSCEFAMRAGLAIEMIHTYSLIHDDLPAMDDDDLRRGKLTCHKYYDEATAILAGDSLLTFAFELLSDSSTYATAEMRIKIINVVAKSIGYCGMAGGQMLDMLYEKKPISLEQIYTMQGMKTAALFRACGQLAAIILNVDLYRTANIMKFSYALGLSFQIIDDILDEIGDVKKIGKHTKKDLESGKARLVENFGVDGAREQADRLLNWGLEYVKHESNFAFYQDIAHYIKTRQY
jgi:farnesyl diphosphate synthase